MVMLYCNKVNTCFKKTSYFLCSPFSVPDSSLLYPCDPLLHYMQWFSKLPDLYIIYVGLKDPDTGALVDRRMLKMKKRIIALLLTLLMVFSVAAASAATYYRVNTSSLKVRQFDDENSKALASRERDFALTVSKKVGSWSYVKFTNGDEGYVMNKYITKCSSYSAWVTNDDTPIRTGPGYSYSNVGTLARGSKVTVLTHGTKYDYVKSSIGYGYVMNGFLSKKKVKASGNASVPAFTPATNYTAWVSNGTRSVNLRLNPSTSAPIIQAYPTATQVTVLSHGATWDYVQIGSETGYMMTSFLSKNAPAPDAAPAPAPAPAASYTAYVTSDNQKGVNVRRGPGLGETYLFTVPYGAQVTVVKHDTKWDKIQYNGKTGYMQNKYLTLNEPPAAAVTPAPATPAVTYPYNATLTCKEGEKVNLRSKPWKTSTAVFRLDPGTVVKVVGPVKYNGKVYKSWLKVEYNGTTVYVMKEFLK